MKLEIRQNTVTISHGLSHLLLFTPIQLSEQEQTEHQL